MQMLISLQHAQVKLPFTSEFAVAGVADATAAAAAGGNLAEL